MLPAARMIEHNLLIVLFSFLQEEWFEVEDREMAAYHRGQMRGLRVARELLETKLKLVEVGPQADDVAASARSGLSRN